MQKGVERTNNLNLQMFVPSSVNTSMIPKIPMQDRLHVCVCARVRRQVTNCRACEMLQPIWFFHDRTHLTKQEQQLEFTVLRRSEPVLK